MGFVNENITETDKARIDFSNIKHPIYKISIFHGTWTVDCERDIALIPFGGGRERGENPWIFVMYWQGKTIDVLLYGSVIIDPEKNIEATWRLGRIGPLEEISQEEFLKTLKEALFTYGIMTMQLRDKVKTVNFEF